MSINHATALPSGRISRLFKLGKLATGVAASALNQGARQIGRSEKLSRTELLLSPSNAERIAEELAQMRGAAMKVGQLLSMEAGDILPRELTDLLARLRDGAHAMPATQLEPRLAAAWGDRWRSRFRHFEEQPFAAASIGQVHRAEDQQGRRLAIKIQYPGVAESIDSDVANVATLLKVLKVLPAGFDIDPLLEIARLQLHDETDYEREAEQLRRYREQLRNNPVFQVPEVIDAFSGPGVLAMTFIEGNSIETVAAMQPELRDRLAEQLVDLCLREFLDWGVVQTDPNFANFLYDEQSGTIGLLDFGALRENAAGREQQLARLLQAAMNRDLAAIIEAACDIGYLAPSDAFNDRLAVADLIQTAAEPALDPGVYDFAGSRLSQVMTDKMLQMRDRLAFQRIPPEDVIFLHRKLAGIFLLCARLHARVDVNRLVSRYLN